MTEAQAQLGGGKQVVKLLLELGPLVAFFIVNGKWGILPGTAAFMAATAVALPTAWMLMRQIPIMPLVSGVFVLGFGGLTLYFEDEVFIKLKPTIVNLLFATILFGGLALRLQLLQRVLGQVIALSDWGWRVLGFRWAVFFVCLAALNEIVWRTQSTETWIEFKLFGIMPLTLVFSLAQMPLINRYLIQDPETDDGETDSD
jgi:intracellular septation protein